MSSVTVLLPYSPEPSFARTLQPLVQSRLVHRILIAHDGSYQSSEPKCEGLQTASPSSGDLINRALSLLTTDYLMLVTQSHELVLGQAALERFCAVAASTGAGMVYADYFEVKNGARSEHPLID